MWVLLEVHITIPADDHLLGLAARLLNLKRRHLR
jgi:hypothetical protein